MFQQEYCGVIQTDKADLSNIDPSLDACCQREAEGNRKKEAAESLLRRHDRVALAERRRRNLIKNMTFGEGCRCCYDPNGDGGEYPALVEARAARDAMRKELEGEAHDDDEKEEEKERSERNVTNYSHDDSDSDSDDSEFDYLLDEDLPFQSTTSSSSNNFQRDRIEELQYNALIRESALQHGFGTHRQLGPDRVLQAAGLGADRRDRRGGPAAIPPAAVLHLFDGLSPLCASLDLCLEEMADDRYKGTKFLRSNGRATMHDDPTLFHSTNNSVRNVDDLPALIAIRDGVVVASCPKLSTLGDVKEGRVEPNAVEEWLNNAGVLLRDLPLDFEDYCRIRPEEDALLENMMREKMMMKQDRGEEEFYDCGVEGCQKTFHHEHVGVKNERQDGLLVSEEDALGTSAKDES